jgi:hypothetical protein
VGDLEIGQLSDFESLPEVIEGSACFLLILDFHKCYPQWLMLFAPLAGYEAKELLTKVGKSSREEAWLYHYSK